MAEINFAQLIEPVARKLWGAPNKALSTSAELRWGSRGSRAVNINQGTWYDHEAGEGGGTLDLITRETEATTHKDALAWLEREQLINGYDRSAKKIVATYDYVDEIGKLLFQVVRYEPKDFRQRQPDGGGGWIWNIKGVRRVVYQLPLVIQTIARSEPVFIVEGEKDCLALGKLGIAATTNPGGANRRKTKNAAAAASKWLSSYSDFFRNAHVVLVPDNDETGRDHMTKVTTALSSVAKTIRLLDLATQWPGGAACPAKADISDWLTAGGTAAKLVEIVEAAPQWTPPVRPTILLIAGELPRIVDEAEAALIAAGGFDLYQRGGLLCRPVLSKLKASYDRETLAWRLIAVRQPYLLEVLTRVADFRRYDARAKAYVSKDCPQQVAETYLAREGHWRLPLLLGVTDVPFLRADGSLCDQPGYDPASGVLLRADGPNVPAIPHMPKRADALDAMAMLDDLLMTFPFIADADRSVALAGILTALDRRAMTTAPLICFSAPVAGSGKSLLTDIAAVIATGQLAPVVAQGRNEEELEKRLGSALLQGDAIISIDNAEHQLEGAFLCQALTQQRLNIRLLGHSRIVEVPVSAAIFANGNNLQIAGDLTRRAILCTIDARCERPETRRFDNDPIAIARVNRGALVAAALTILRAWRVAGDRIGLTPFGSFEDWSYRVREPLTWLGCADPVETAAKVRDNDPKRAALNAVLVQWKQHFGVGPLRNVQEVITGSASIPEFQAALITVAGNRSGNLVKNDRLGRWLKRVEGRIINGLVLVQAGTAAGYPQWQVMTS